MSTHNKDMPKPATPTVTFEINIAQAINISIPLVGIVTFYDGDSMIKSILLGIK